MSVKKILLLLMSVMATAALGLAGERLLTSHAIHTVAKRVTQDATIDRSLFASLVGVRIEWGHGLNGLAMEPEAGLWQRQVSMGARPALDQASTAAATAMAGLPDADLAAKGRELTAALGAWTSLRPEIDRAYLQPLAERDKTLVKRGGELSGRVGAQVDRFLATVRAA